MQLGSMDYNIRVFLLAGMIVAALAYLFYANPSTPKDDSAKTSLADSSVVSTAVSLTADDKPTAATPYIGIAATNIDPVVADQLNIPAGSGVLITSVISGSPAEAAGLIRGDAITAFNNKDVSDLAALRELVSDVKPSDVVRVVFIRQGQADSLYLTIGASAQIELVAGTDDPTDPLNLGMTVAALTDGLRATYGVPTNIDGVIIVAVVTGGTADSMGIMPGDVISALDGSDITDMASFFEAAYDDTDETSLLNIYSRGQYRYVPIASLETSALCLTDPIELEDFDSYQILFRVVPLVGVAGLGFALLYYLSLFRYPRGTAKMRAIAEKIHSGTKVFLRQEYKVTGIFLMIFFILICSVLCLPTGIAFLVGAACSMLPGWIGMKAATTANIRTCQAARQEGLGKALNIAFEGGAVMGISVASVGLIGLGTYCLVVLTSHDPETLPFVIAGYCLGASFFALFGRVGGGIFSKSADIGADMTGKVEYDLPEDDPRNPAVIADNVGDNVADVAGMGSDLFESYTSSTVATIIMALRMNELEYVVLPLVLIAIGLLCCLITIGFSQFFTKRADPQTFLRNVIVGANILFIIGAFATVIAITGQFSLFLAVVAGVLCGILIGIETEYFGSGLPIKYIVNMSKTGAATNIIAGLSMGFLGALLPILTICATIIITLCLAGLYGIGLSAVGMLGTMAIIMSIDAYGPIVDNAGGIATMSRTTKQARIITDKLDIAGNISAAIGKGFTIGTGVITTVALFAAYIHGTQLAHTELFTPVVLVGLFVGVTLPLLFAALTMTAVTRIANKLVIEVRRQFKEIKGLLTGKAEPDTDRCVDIIAHDSLRATVVAGIIAAASPFVVFFILGVEAMAGFLVGAMLTGSVLGMSMAIGGSAWDNAKKYIERQRDTDEEMAAAHKAAVVGDMVGDPFKDVSGPAMNILIKLMVTIALVFCSIFCVT